MKNGMRSFKDDLRKLLDFMLKIVRNDAGIQCQKRGAIAAGKYNKEYRETDYLPRESIVPGGRKKEIRKQKK